MAEYFDKSILAAALNLADKGVPCFPCNSSKGPSCPGSFKAATTDKIKLAELWKSFPGLLIGVPTGEITKISILDIDPRNGGLQWLLENGKKLGTTRIHHTRSGGYHYFFKYVAGLKNSANSIANGVDVRSEGGYIIWWPSLGFRIENNNTLINWPGWLGQKELI